MKRFGFLFLFLITLMPVVAQNQKDPLPTKVDQEKELDNTIVEVRAAYPGGDAAIIQHVAKNLKYPKIAIEQGLQGVVVLRFEVKKDGTIGRINVIRGISKECDQAACDVVKTLKRFTPARQQGEPVAVWISLPIRFQL